MEKDKKAVKLTHAVQDLLRPSPRQKGAIVSHLIWQTGSHKIWCVGKDPWWENKKDVCMHVCVCVCVNIMKETTAF